MISLKKYINSSSKAGKESKDVPAGARESAGLLSAYQAALAAMGSSGQKAIPALGNMIGPALARIGDSLTPSVSPEALREARSKVEEELGLWADKAQQHQKNNERAIEDLLIVLARAAESTGVRDEKFGRELSGLSDRLRTVAGLDSLPLIRRSIIDNASALTTCVTKMADEGRESVRKLSSEIAEYQTRLQASERRALVDALTGLCNRRGFEQQLELRVATRQQFSLLVADLNGFKAANDRHGHVAGDQILRQFATEFSGQFPPGDTVARWGGDEFAAIITGPEKEGAARAERVRQGALGEYKIAVENQTTAVTVDAAPGTATWDGVESGLQLFARADKEMYRAKRGVREPVKV